MHMHTAIRAASFTQPPTQAKNLPLSNGRASADVIDLMGTVIPFARNTEVYGENEPAEYLYKVISGTVRTYKVLVDGRRQIGAFHVCGDVFGFETDAEGRTVVEVHQVVRDLAGLELLNQRIEHIYSIEGGLIRRMDIGAVLGPAEAE